MLILLVVNEYEYILHLNDNIVSGDYYVYLFILQLRVVNVIKVKDYVTSLLNVKAANRMSLTPLVVKVVKHDVKTKITVIHIYKVTTDSISYTCGSGIDRCH